MTGFVPVLWALFCVENNFFKDLSSSYRLQNTVGNSQMFKIGLTLLIWEQNWAITAAKKRIYVQVPQMCVSFVLHFVNEVSLQYKKIYAVCLVQYLRLSEWPRWPPSWKPSAGRPGGWAGLWSGCAQMIQSAHQRRREQVKINKGCSSILYGLSWQMCRPIRSLLPQLHSAGSCLGGSFLALLGSRQVPSPGLSGSRAPPWCTLLTWWLEAEWGWPMAALWTCPPGTLLTGSKACGLATQRWNWFVPLNTGVRKKKKHYYYLFFLLLLFWFSFSNKMHF